MREKNIYTILIAFIFAITASAEFEFKIEGRKFSRENTDFGLDVASHIGYPISLSLNDKPERYDLSENYEPVAPGFAIRAGVGGYSDSFSPPANLTIAFEFGYQAFENDSTDLALYTFSLFNQLSHHPCSHLSVATGKGTGLYMMNSTPERSVTSTFADYSSDSDSRTGALHLFDSRELSFGASFGKKPLIELSAGVRVNTYYPRFLFWKEAVRGATYGLIEGAFDIAAKQSEVWALSPVGDAVVTTLELFNLNFYPDAVGITHQHILSPGVNLTVHF